MHLSQIRRALVAAAAFVAFAAIAPAHADFTGNIPVQLPLQILDPSGVCASWLPGGTATAPTLTCVAAATGGPGQPVCSLTASPSTITSAATPVTVTATCTNTDANTTWAWSSVPASSVQATTTGPSQQIQTPVTVSGTTTFTVTATANGVASAPKTAKVTLSTGGGGGGGGGGTGACSGYANTIVMNLSYVPGSVSQQITSSAFGNNDIVVATFRTPATLTNGGNGGFLNVVEAGGGPNGRTAALSTSPPPTCDMSPNSATRATNYSSGSNYAKIYFRSDPNYGVVLQPDTQYYFYVTNRSAAGAGTCPGGNCPVAVTLQAR